MYTGSLARNKVITAICQCVVEREGRRKVVDEWHYGDCEGDGDEEDLVERCKCTTPYLSLNNKRYTQYNTIRYVEGVLYCIVLYCIVLYGTRIGLFVDIGTDSGNKINMHKLCTPRWGLRGLGSVRLDEGISGRTGLFVGIYKYRYIRIEREGKGSMRMRWGVSWDGF